MVALELYGAMDYRIETQNILPGRKGTSWNAPKPGERPGGPLHIFREGEGGLQPFTLFEPRFSN